MQRENTLTREIHNLLQGSDDWHVFRFNHHGASEAAAMLGLSKKVTRSELVRMKATGLAKEFSDWVQENILDYGHEVEALARPLAERIIGDDLYPATLSLGRESASCDGLNMAETIGFEHKQWNAELAASVSAGVLPDEHQPQVQQQLMVTGAEKWLFMASDGTENNMVWMWVYPDAAWFERIVAGWQQFDIDVANYTQVDHAVKPEAAPAAALPALVVQTEGKVVSSNLMAYQKAAEKFLSTIKTDLQDDQDFADAEYNVKFCGEAEAKLEHAKAAALAQTSTIDEVMRTVDHIKAQFRAKRLELEKLVKTRKEQIKETILNDGRRAYADHVATLETEIAPLRLQLATPDFAGAMKNKRTLASLHDAVNTTLANAKIAANQAAADTRVRDITPASIRTWIGTLSLSAASINQMLIPFRSVLDQAVNDDLIDSSPLDRVKLRKVLSRDAYEKTPTADPFSADEIKKILTVADEQLRNVWLFAFATGMRPSEYIALQWESIDWEDCTVKVERARVVGVTSKNTKTKSSKRVIDLRRGAYEALRAQEQYSRLANGPVFLDPATGRGWDTSDRLNRVWIPTLKKAGVRHRTQYQTRHTFASTLLSAGENLMYVAKQMGHADTTMVTRIYARWLEQDDGLLPDFYMRMIEGKKRMIR